MNQKLTEREKNVLSKLNRKSLQYGLSLSEKEIEELLLCRKQALSDTGRVEFGGGILPKLVEAFCDSPYLEKDTYTQTLSELQDLFYYYKNECAESLSDEELIAVMEESFNGCAQGSTEYLSEMTLEELCRELRNKKYGED